MCSCCGAVCCGPALCALGERSVNRGSSQGAQRTTASGDLMCLSVARSWCWRVLRLLLPPQMAPGAGGVSHIPQRLSGFHPGIGGLAGVGVPQHPALQAAFQYWVAAWKMPLCMYRQASLAAEQPPLVHTYKDFFWGGDNLPRRRGSCHLSSLSHSPALPCGSPAPVLWLFPHHLLTLSRNSCHSSPALLCSVAACRPLMLQC